MRNRNTDPMNKHYGGGPSCINENLTFFAEKLKEVVDSDKKMTFRQWTNTFMNLLDLID